VIKGNSGTLGALKIYNSAMKAEDYGKKRKFHPFQPRNKKSKK
jgi:HPt (histidine-containing phosphotransfer) domain-containing protein